MGVTVVDLYRSGSSSSARLEKVRLGNAFPTDPEIGTRIDPSGVLWVLKDTGGVSTWEAAKPTWLNRVWRLPSGSAYPAGLKVWNDDPGHWVWEPEQDMTLTDYQDLLGQMNPPFVRVK